MKDRILFGNNLVHTNYILGLIAPQQVSRPPAKANGNKCLLKSDKGVVPSTEPLGRPPVIKTHLYFYNNWAESPKSIAQSDTVGYRFSILEWAEGPISFVS